VRVQASSAARFIHYLLRSPVNTLINLIVRRLLLQQFPILIDI
jgi:hypothetical protein